MKKWCLLRMERTLARIICDLNNRLDSILTTVMLGVQDKTAPLWHVSQVDGLMVDAAMLQTWSHVGEVLIILGNESP